MTTVTPGQFSFNGGEQSPRFAGRVDQSVRSIGAKKMRGWLPLLQGPAEAAPGTIRVAAAKGPCVLIPFEFNVTQGYQIEAGENYLRFFTNDAQIMAGGAPYEIASPWTYLQVKDLRWYQSKDALYMVHPEVPPHKLLRLGADSFSLVEIELTGGPFAPRNADKAHKLACSAAGAVDDIVTITANKDSFAATDVGRLLEIEPESLGDIAMWEPGMQFATNSFVQWSGRVYQRTGGKSRSGGVPPEHFEGEEYDGGNTQDAADKVYGQKWLYICDSYGLVRITDVIDAQTVTAVVLRAIASTAESWHWRFGAFGKLAGYPLDVTMWQDRLTFGQDSRVHVSAKSDYENFGERNELGDISLDMGFTVQLPNPNVISWILADRDLVIGTLHAEHVVSGRNEGLGPGSYDLSMPSEEGSAAARVLRVDGRAVFVQRARQKVRQMVYSDRGLYRSESPDLTRAADHIGTSPIEEMLYQREPERLIWVRHADGSLSVAAYMPEEQLLGWAPREMAEGVECRSISKNTDPDGRYEQVWTAATVDGEWQILRMDQVRRSGDESMSTVMSDAALLETRAASDQISIPWLKNREVEVVADGKYHPPVNLDENGDGQLEYAASEIRVGLPFLAEIEPWPIEGGSENGTSQNKIRRISRVDIQMLACHGLKIAVQGSEKKIENLTFDTPTDSAIAPFSGFHSFECVGSSERIDDIKITRYLPFPQTLVACVPYVNVGQR